MRLSPAILALAFAASPAAALEPPKGESVTIGPWRVEAAYKGDRFERCVILVQFGRTASGLDLGMSSTKWKLGRGKSYPVELVAGTSVIMAEVEASGSAVSVPIQDDRFLRSLKLADGLEVRGEGSTLHVALEKSAAGLERLDTCLTKNLAPSDTNPFVAPDRKP
jgi:hypothetical protein